MFLPYTHFWKSFPFSHPFFWQSFFSHPFWVYIKEVKWKWSPQQQQQEEKEQHFPRLDLSASPQVKIVFIVTTPPKERESVSRAEKERKKVRPRGGKISPPGRAATTFWRTTPWRHSVGDLIPDYLMLEDKKSRRLFLKRQNVAATFCGKTIYWRPHGWRLILEDILTPTPYLGPSAANEPVRTEGTRTK